jgi:hypothetical protein
MPTGMGAVYEHEIGPEDCGGGLRRKRNRSKGKQPDLSQHFTPEHRRQ